MPMKEVTLRRWEAVGILALLVASYVVAILLVSRESTARANANRDLIVEIQQSRAEITFTGCLEQYERHDRTIDKLDMVLTQRKAEIREAIQNADSPIEAAALRAQIDGLDDARATTVSLVDALQPNQNCTQLVLDRFGFVPELRRPED